MYCHGTVDGVDVEEDVVVAVAVAVLALFSLSEASSNSFVHVRTK